MPDIKVLAVPIMSLGLAAPALAQEMRCGNELIAGDQIHPLLESQVLEKCGEPDKKEGRQWYYEAQGKILVFDGNGELDHIEDADEE